MEGVRMKKRINISISEDTEERLKQYAFEHHKTVSQTITDWIWSVRVENTQIRGQKNFGEMLNKASPR